MGSKEKHIKNGHKRSSVGQPPKGENGRRTNIRLYDEDRIMISFISVITKENTSDMIRRLIKEEYYSIGEKT